MRPLIVAAALALSGCGIASNTAQDAPGCAASATHDVTWTNPDAPDVVTASASGPSCTQAVVSFVARNAAGDPLWAFAAPYYEMTTGGQAPAGAPATEMADVERFLAGWANVTEMRAGALPEWRAGVATLTESAGTFAYATPYDRETYEMLRARDLPMICYAAGVETSQCLIVDPASRAPAMIVAYGP